MDDEQHDAPPICESCNNAILIVKYMLLQCPAYRSQRRRMKGQLVTLRDMLGDDVDVAGLMQVLKETQMYDRI